MTADTGGGPGDVHTRKRPFVAELGKMSGSEEVDCRRRSNQNGGLLICCSTSGDGSEIRSCDCLVQTVHDEVIDRRRCWRPSIL